MLSLLLKYILDDNNPDLTCIAEIKPKTFIRILSLVEFYIHGYNLEAINILAEKGKSMLHYFKNSV